MEDRLVDCVTICRWVESEGSTYTAFDTLEAAKDYYAALVATPDYDADAYSFIIEGRYVGNGRTTTYKGCYPDLSELSSRR